MRRAVIIVLALVLGLGLNAQPLIGVSATFDKDTILIGDHFHLTLEVQHAPGVDIFLPEFSDTAGQLEFISATEIDTTEKDGQLTNTREYTLSIYYPGIYQLPGVPVVYRQGDMVDTMQSAPLSIFVKTVEVDTAQPIKPIKGPLKTPLTWKEIWPYVAIGGGALLIAAIVLILLMRKKEKDKAYYIRKAKLEAHQIALDKLKTLEKQKLWQQGEVKEHHLRLSEIVREYMESRYVMQAMESTTPEIIEKLKNKGLRKQRIEQMQELLEICDLAKFAKMRPMPDQITRAMQYAYAFVEETKLKKEELEDDKK